jgi:hypothetical protein
MISCNRSKEYEYLGQISAGQKEGVGIKYIAVMPKDTSLGYYPSPEIQTKKLDLNSDDIDDFELIYTTNHEFQSHFFIRLEIKPQGENSVITISPDKSWADSIKLNEIIDNSKNWSDSTTLLFDYQYLTYTMPNFYDTTIIKGYWWKQENIFIGIRMKKNGHQYFGWIYLTVNKTRGNVEFRQFAITKPY